MTTDDQTKQVNTLLKGLAGATCPDCKGSTNGKHLYTTVRDGQAGRDFEDGKDCNGSGLAPRTDMFRVTCDHPVHVAQGAPTAPSSAFHDL